MKSFIFLRQNVDGISEKDTEELAETLKVCSAKLDKIVQRIKDKK